MVLIVPLLIIAYLLFHYHTNIGRDEYIHMEKSKGTPRFFHVIFSLVFVVENFNFGIWKNDLPYIHTCTLAVFKSSASVKCLRDNHEYVGTL